MFGLKRAAYRRKVETKLSYLIDFNEPYFRRLYGSFDGIRLERIRSVIAEAHEKNRPTIVAAIDLWGIMFTYEIERTPDLVADGERVIAFLKDGGEYRADTELMMRAYFLNADGQAVMGNVPNEIVEICANEIVGALRGIPREERVAMRWRDVFEESFPTAFASED